MITIPTREEVGLPARSTILRVIHNQAARCTLVELQERGSPAGRLYCREAGSLKYNLVGSPDPDQSYEDALTCARPVVFTRCSRCTRSGDGWKGVDEGIAMIDLLKKPLGLTPLGLGPILPSGSWVSRLLRSDDSGTSLEAIVAVREPVVGHPAHKQVRYTVCLLDLANQRLVELDALPGVHF
jgi:hypothetical protein